MVARTKNNCVRLGWRPNVDCGIVQDVQILIDHVGLDFSLSRRKTFFLMFLPILCEQSLPLSRKINDN